ncbi:hypothetical protein FRZ00_28145, partial [Streptomyces mobaraensis]
GTDASFVLTRETLSGFPPGASLRCFQPYQIRIPFRFRFEFRFRPPVGAGFRLLAFTFRRFRLYQIFSGPITRPIRFLLRSRGASQSM